MNVIVLSPFYKSADEKCFLSLITAPFSYKMITQDEREKNITLQLCFFQLNSGNSSLCIGSDACEPRGGKFKIN